MTSITIHRQGAEYGPYSHEEVRKHLGTGHLVEDDWAIIPGMSDWQPLREVMAGLSTESVNSPEMPPLPTADTDRLTVLTDICARALALLLAHLGQASDVAGGFSALVKDYDRFRTGQGNSERLRQALGFPDLTEFNEAMRLLARYLDKATETPQSHRNAVIAALRFIDWLGTAAKRLPQLQSLLDRLAGRFDENRGRKQVRAVELVVRALITERHAGQDELLNNLRAFFTAREIEAIEKNAPPGDLLSGTEFSQLTSLFVQPDEFKARYAFIYDQTALLNFVRDKRKTLRMFLEDMRRIRNSLAHHRPMTPAQLELLDLYYEEVVSPIQHAHDEGQVKVDPDRHLDVGEAELQAYFAALREDLQEVRDELQRIGKRIEEIHSGVGWLRRHAPWLGAGVAAILLVVLVTASRTEKTLEVTRDVKQDTSEIKSDVKQIDTKLDKVKQETSNDPRKELANLGIPWKDEAFLQAAEKGDTRTLDLFFAAGYNYKSDLILGSIAEWFEWEFDNRFEMIDYLRIRGYDFTANFTYEPRTFHFVRAPIDTAILNNHRKSYEYLVQHYAEQLKTNGNLEYSFEYIKAEIVCARNADRATADARTILDDLMTRASPKNYTSFFHPANCLERSDLAFITEKSLDAACIRKYAKRLQPTDRDSLLRAESTFKEKMTILDATSSCFTSELALAHMGAESAKKERDRYAACLAKEAEQRPLLLQKQRQEFCTFGRK